MNSWMKQHYKKVYIVLLVGIILAVRQLYIKRTTVVSGEQEQQLTWKYPLLIPDNTRPEFQIHGHFLNHSSGAQNLLVILSGYKPFLYHSVFQRIQIFMEPEIDVCVLSVGVKDEKLVQICTSYNWSYISTEEKLITKGLNVAIELHPRAQFIFKLDEDIFVTRGFFGGLLKAFKHAEAGLYRPGVIAPLLTVNRYSSYRLLQLFNCTDDFVGIFGPSRYPLEIVWDNPSAASYFWGNSSCLPSLDKMNYILRSKPTNELPIPFKFSIGAILFPRFIWKDMGYFDNNRPPQISPFDENQLNTYCFLRGRMIIVSENVVAGHFSFFKIVKEMRSYYEQNPQHYEIEDVS